MEYEIVIGLEVHCELSTKSKVFCSCSTQFGQAPNTQVCPVCLGLPGTLPVLNEKALEYAVKVALALNCSIEKFIKFDRKNYFYPDLPKAFQISQYDRPLSYDGYLQLSGEDKRVKIKRVHLEEDTGKLIHRPDIKASIVDYNRSGVPLLEIVTEPDINSPEQAYNYLVSLKAVLEYLDVSDCNMEEGSLRCDANISLKPKGEKRLGTKTEIKNMNSFRGVRAALEYEVKRQTKILSEGGSIHQETRLYDVSKNTTSLMRKKEEAHDYRYFPEPDLVPFVYNEEKIEQIKTALPELPDDKKTRFINTLGISEYDAGVLVADKRLSDYFEKTLDIYFAKVGKDNKNAKFVTNWIMVELLGQLNSRNKSIKELNLKVEDFAEMLILINKGVINGKIAKDVLPLMIDSAKTANQIIKEKNLVQLSDKGELDEILEQVISENQNSVNDYLGGKEKSFMFLVGQTMKLTRGRANPKVVTDMLKQKLSQQGVKND